MKRAAATTFLALWCPRCTCSSVSNISKLDEVCNHEIGEEEGGRKRRIPSQLEIDLALEEMDALDLW